MVSKAIVKLFGKPYYLLCYGIIINSMHLARVRATQVAYVTWRVKITLVRNCRTHTHILVKTYTLPLMIAFPNSTDHFLVLD